MTARSSAEEFWPFLISRGHVTTYRVVVAPRFLCEADLAGLLYDLSGGDPTPPGHARYRVVRGTAAGDFVLLFRVRLGELEGSAGRPGVPLRDEHGRRIPVIDGVVERVRRFDPTTGAGVLDDGRSRCRPQFREFWEAGDGSQVPHPSVAFAASRAQGGVVRWEALPEYVVARLTSSVSPPDADHEREREREPEPGESPGGAERWPRRLTVGAAFGLAAGLAGWAVTWSRSHH
ncbi:hypothetical protein QMK19_40065 [Streptomyces sp. H10-C2]|uniref:hypothetical protein n=1 Tax=unclassified Streptomyces TaxID=2593676 RepID=UPI0024B8C934|nr:MULTISPECIES: hypothetical protein [unclassified Streptomyces]MDJ0347374.1 hypothetical protein [Streptomyces sp. PH10-H1]MDJ0375617.1 hypothetical protein [Streptomyces sp. H10-C2]